MIIIFTLYQYITRCKAPHNLALSADRKKPSPLKVFVYIRTFGLIEETIPEIRIIKRKVAIHTIRIKDNDYVAYR